MTDFPHKIDKQRKDQRKRTKKDKREYFLYPFLIQRLLDKRFHSSHMGFIRADKY
jgi:hypothetical protein